MDWIDRITDNSFVLNEGREIFIPSDEYAEVKSKYSAFAEKYGEREAWNAEKIINRMEGR